MEFQRWRWKMKGRCHKETAIKDVRGEMNGMNSKVRELR